MSQRGLPIQSEINRERHYLVSADHDCNPSDFEFVNKATALVDGQMAGTHEMKIPGERYPRWFGIPPLKEKPKLIVGLSDQPLLDAYGLSHRHYVSDRAKNLLTKIEADAFEFAECDTTDGEGLPTDPYWMMATMHIVHDFDRERSDFITYAERNPGADDVDSNPSLSVLNDIYLGDENPKAWHVFDILNYDKQFIFDGVAADAWQSSNFRGWKLTPLQPPTEKEYDKHLSFYNYPYWTDRRWT